MKRLGFLAVALVATLGLPACSNSNGSNTNGNGGTGTGSAPATVCINPNAQSGSGGTALQCAAVAVVYDTLDNKQIMSGSSSVEFTVPPDDGHTTDVPFTISNIANTFTAADLYVMNIAISYEPTSPNENAASGDIAFTCLAADLATPCSAVKGHWPKVVPAGMEDNKTRVSGIPFVIRYKRFDALNRAAVVHITFAGDTNFKTKTFDFSLSTKLGKPSITVPVNVDFPFAAPNTEAQQIVKVTNSGNAPLHISKIGFTADDGFYYTLDDDAAATKHLPGKPAEWTTDPPITVAVGSSIQLHVFFSPKDDKKRSGVLLFFSDDPASGVVGAKTTLTANAAVPCMLLSAKSINFGGVKFGTTMQKTLDISNTCTAALVISQIIPDVKPPNETNTDEFTIDWKKAVKDATALDATNSAVSTTKGPSVAAPITIPVNGKLTLWITYGPTDLTPIDPKTGQVITPDNLKLTLMGNDFNSPHSVLITGIGVKDTCPVAAAEIKEGEEVVPQTLVHLKGDASYSPAGALTKYKWTCTQPVGSNQPLMPNPTTPNPTLQANTSGTYSCCLDVWDINDVKSCQPGCVSVNVVPNDAIHVELLWDTPADPDQTDTGPSAGADLDLHLASDMALGKDVDCDGYGDPWFSSPFDCFWFNAAPNPPWGSASGVNNPLLALDDTDGAGPENINLSQPEGTQADPVYYSVGVHYWNDHGFGTSFATTTIYLQGMPVVKVEKVQMAPLDMWYVGKINWPNKLVGGNLPAVSMCYESGDACLTLSDPSNPAAGKMWKPSGEYCITKCYESPTFIPGAASCK